MKGLYLSNLDGEKAVGYQSKIVGQIRGLVKNGIEFELISFSRTGEILLHTDLTYSTCSQKKILVLKQASSSLFSRRKRFFDAALERLKETLINVLYIRYPRSDPMYLFFLYRVKKIYPEIQIFCEFPTFPYDQEKPTGSILKHTLIQALDRGTRSFLRLFVDRIVVVNYEGSIFGIKSIGISNGISTSDYPLKKTNSRRTEQTVNLLGVANVKAWHGYDRVISGLGDYHHQLTQGSEVTFHIVGACKPILGELKLLASQLAVERYVFFYPPLQNEELDKLFDLCDIGISTLAPHRIGLQELSPLKTREYCARGMPFLLGYSDPDFLDSFNYASQWLAEESPIDIKEVLKFAQAIYSDPHCYSKIRQYSEENLDWSIKMASVANQMIDLITTSGCQ